MQIKSHYCTERYALLNLDRNQRSVLAQLRCSILPLHVETGRFTNKKLQDRKCGICNSDEVEDEYHFLFHCTYYQDERRLFMSQLTGYPNFNNLNNHVKLLTLFNFEPRKLAKFVCRILEKRRQKMYT